jgi:YbgC/YbaW family acyl-CoA thioester hydrolase
MTLLKKDFRFSHRLRVRWAEVDMQKIVFNAHYLMYLDTAVADYWRVLGLPYESTLQELGGDLYVKKATLEYHASARYDDVLDVALRCAKVGNSSMVFVGSVWCGDALLVSGELVYVFADPVSQTSRPVPQGLRDVLTAYEAGESMLRVETGDWKNLHVPSTALRNAVFVQEQGIDAHVVYDAADAIAVHAVATNRLGRAIGSGRLVRQSAGVGRIGRMAVDRAVRGTRVGLAVLDALVLAARKRGDHEVMLHAQTSAEAFYLRRGFVPRGDYFQEASITHIEMVLPLGEV